MSWLLEMYGDDEPGDQVNTLYTLTPRIVEESYREQMEGASYVGILENTPRQVIDPTPTGVSNLAIGAGVAGAAAIGAGLYFGYHSLAHRKSPEDIKRDEEAKMVAQKSLKK